MTQMHLETVPNAVPRGVPGTVLEQCSGTAEQRGTVCSVTSQLPENKGETPEHPRNSSENRHSLFHSPRFFRAGVEGGMCSSANPEALK